MDENRSASGFGPGVACGVREPMFDRPLVSDTRVLAEVGAEVYPRVSRQGGA